MIKNLNEGYEKPYMIADEKGRIYTVSSTKLEEISDLASKEVLDRVEKYLTRNNNKGTADAALYDLLFDAKTSLATVNEYVKRYYKTDNESKSRTEKRSIKEYIEQVDGYAVQIHDMGKGYVHLLLFNDKSTAEEVLESLEYLESAEDMDEEMFYAEVDRNVDIADDIVNEIDWRREVDNNDVWTASDDTKYKIVGIVDL